MLCIYILNVVLLEGEMLLLLTGTADFSHPRKVTSHLCDGLMPFVGFFSRSYRNTERLIKSRKENQLLCKRSNTKHLKIFRVLLSDLSEPIFRNLFACFCWLTFILKGYYLLSTSFSNALYNLKEDGQRVNTVKHSFMKHLSPSFYRVLKKMACFVTKACSEILLKFNLGRKWHLPHNPPGLIH